VFLAAVLAVKLAIVSQLEDHPLLQPDAGLDTGAYVQLARRVAGGDLTLGPGLYYLSPLYIYFLAAALSLADSLHVVRALQAVLGTAAVACVFLAARRWYGERAGWIAATLAALTGVFTFYEAVLFQSALDPFLTAVALWCLASGGPVPSGFSRNIGLAGLVFGLQILNRPNIAIAVAGVVLTFLVLRRWRTAAALAAGVLVALSPIVIRNVVVSHQFALTSSHGGLNFYIGNLASATGQYTEVPGVRANIDGQSEDTRKVAEQAEGRALTDSEVSAHFRDLALAWIRSNPGAAAALFVKKLALVFNARHQWLDFSYPYYAYDAGTSLWLLFIGPWLLVPLGIAGFAARTRDLRDPASLAGPAFAAFYAVSIAIFFVGERYRLPLFVALCVGAGGALDLALQRMRLRTMAVAAVLAAVVTFWPFRIADGRFDERLRLSKVLMNRGDYGLAAMELERAHAIDPAHTIAEFNLGMALISSGRAPEGLGHVRHAVDAGVEMPGARYALAAALLATGDRAGAADVLRASSPAPEDTAESCYRVALLAMDAGVPDAGVRYARQALALRPGWQEAEDLLAQLRK
jgi:4-amino-4-deoxy-L-arabinose transferase-like glycosyltransferase